MAKWLITGASGLLGYNACQYLLGQGHEVVGISNSHAIDLVGVDERKCDLMDFDATRALIMDVNPDVILHCAAMTNVDACEDDAELTRKYHVELSELIAQCANQCDAKMVHLTTDQLWDGTQVQVSEETPTQPLNVYGQTKADSEVSVMNACADALIIRTNFFGKGRSWRLSFSDWLDKELSAGNVINGFNDIFYSPISIPHLLQAVRDLVEKNASGVFHVAGAERISKFDFIRLYAEMGGYDVDLVNEQTSQAAQFKAKRPQDMSLNVQKTEEELGYEMPTARQSIQIILDDNSIQQRKVS